MTLVSLADAIELRRNRRLVFTNGVFDILHAGHVRCLEAAKSLGDILIVGMNSDESVRRLKGPSRPINPFADRAEMIRAMRAVDAVIEFEEDNPTLLIKHLKPEVHVKGGDYSAEELPETPLVRSYGGEVVIIPLLAGRSTTKLIDELKDR